MINDVFLNYTNIYGFNLGKIISKERLNNLDNTPISFACLRSDGLGTNPNEEDLYVYPDFDYSNKIVLKNKEIEWIPCFLMQGTQKHIFCPRSILYSAVYKLSEIGFEINIGFEPEFYLLNKDFSPFVQNDSSIPAYNLNGSLSAFEFLSEANRRLELSGINANSIVHEGGISQFEFGLAYNTPIAAVDQLVLFKIILKSLAQENNLIACFMPKPFENDFGSSVQINFSIKNSNDQKILFSSIAGVLKHAKALSAFNCPTFNSYKRLFSTSENLEVSWSPTTISYGINNRSTLLRYISKDNRVEYRSPDFSGNIYLSVAAVLFAIYDGIINELECPAPITQNLFNNSTIGDELEAIPCTLLEALNELKNDSFIMECMGIDFCKDYILNKKNEWFKDYLSIDKRERWRYIDI